MFGARNERDAIGATLLFNVAHYALRPWPWILVGLASLIVFPELSDIASAFPALEADKVGHDVAYPAMLTLLPNGLVGLVAASLLAAFISTMSTQVNLGASYLVHDGWARFIRPDATEGEKVRAGRWASVLSLSFGALLSLTLQSASQAFGLLLLLGAGTGGLYILRWFWWRISATTEIVAMVLSLLVAGYFTWIHDTMGMWPLDDWQKLVLGSFLTTAGWALAAWILPPEKPDVLQGFVDRVQPGGPGWKRFSPNTRGKAPWPVPRQLLQAFLGCVGVYAVLIGTGEALGIGSGAEWLFFGAALAAFVGVARLAKQPTPTNPQGNP